MINQEHISSFAGSRAMLPVPMEIQNSQLLLKSLIGVPSRFVSLTGLHFVPCSVFPQLQRSLIGVPCSIFKKTANCTPNELTVELDFDPVLYGITGDMLSANAFETEQYFYHPDHLGSSSFITDAHGEGYQHLQYLPFGETSVSQKLSFWTTPYQFSAKEKDDETGFSYFGARYYNSDVSVWLSVDPIIKPFETPYAYCFNNPVRFIDPKGRNPLPPFLTKMSYKLQKHLFSTYGNPKAGKELARFINQNSTTLGKKDAVYNSSTNTVEYSPLNGSVTMHGNKTTDGGTTRLQTAMVTMGIIIGSEPGSNHDYDNEFVAWALILRNTKFFGLSPNPFYKAEAIMADIGFTLVGTEIDWGFTYVLAGDDIGKVSFFKERAGGAGSDAGIGVEVTRIDCIGDINSFNLNSINGPRSKAYLGIGEGFSIGGAYSWTIDKSGNFIQGITIQGGIGVSLIPFVSVGGNYGEVMVKK